MAIQLFVVLGITLGLFVISIVLYFVSIYNILIRLRNNIKKSWANIDVLLKQRNNELPKLVDSVKGYMKYEQNVLKELTMARTSFLHAKNLSQKAAANENIVSALKTIFAVAENYPRLKANTTFIQLQERISMLENQIADRREFYNDSINEYNIRIQSFPDMFVANAMNLKPEQMFRVEEKDKEDVQIRF